VQHGEFKTNYDGDWREVLDIILEDSTVLKFESKGVENACLPTDRTNVPMTAGFSL
jgi:hypothetical protein